MLMIAAFAARARQLRPFLPLLPIRLGIFLPTPPRQSPFVILVLPRYPCFARGQ